MGEIIEIMAIDVPWIIWQFFLREQDEGEKNTKLLPHNWIIAARMGLLQWSGTIAADSEL